MIAGKHKRGPPLGETLFQLVGMTGFEPATSSSRTTRATKLRHIPIRCKSNFTRIADAGPGCEIGGAGRARSLDQGVLPGAVEVCEASAAVDEFRGGAVLNHAAVVDHQDAIGSFNGGEAVRDDQRRPAAAGSS